MVRRVTLRDIAERCGVSVAAVSYALNRPAEERLVGARTRARIRSAATEMGYVGSWSARALQAQRSRLIGFLHPSDGLNAFAAGVLSTCSRHLAVAGYDLVVVPMDRDRSWEERLADRRLDAALLYYQADPACLAAADHARLPVVLLNAPSADGTPVTGRHQLLWDDAQLVTTALDHLATEGHRRIAYLGRPRARQGHGSERAREAAYRAWCQSQGRAATIADGYYDSARRWARQATQRRPDAVLCYGDEQALQLTQRLQEQGCAVPADISVMGIGSTSAARWAVPRLSTVAQPMDALCAAAVAAAIDLIDHPERRPITRIIPGKLEARRSTLARST